MLQQIQTYVYERRHGFSRVVGFAGCMYLLGHYVQERLEEMREQVLQDKFNRDNLRRRFLQNRQDTNFIVMTLLTKLGENILEEMDVEGVTNEIQAISRASKRRDPVSELRGEASTQLESNPYAHTHGHRDQDTSSDIASISGTSFAGTEELLSSPQMSNSETTHSWVDEFTSQSVAGTQTHGLTLPSEAPRGDHGHTGNSPQFSVSYLSDSVTSASASDSMMSMSASVSGGSVSASDQGSSRAVGEEDLASSRASASTRTKAELWREVKILTFTRTLTIIYSTTLLSLLTHIQLALVGRSKYVQSVIDLQQDEKLRDYNNSFSSSLGFGGALVSSLFNSLQMFDGDGEDSSGMSSNGGNGVGVGVGGGGGLDSEILPGMRSLQAMNEYTEKKFLTLSWWLLHAGWKDVAERVRKSVEEVFDDVSLKSKLGIKDIHQLICDVRRRVECEITYEGVERRINFSSSMIPPTEETLHRVLISGGIPPSLAGTSATTFTPNTGFSSSPSSYYPSTSTSTTTPLHPHFHSHSQSQSQPQSSSQTYSTPAPPDPAFASLLDETRKIVVSKEFADVLERSLDVAMEVMVRGIARGVFKDQSDGSFDNGLDGKAEEEREEKVRLAGLLPGLARWNHMIVNALPNELADTLADQREMIGFAAMIFSSYDKLL